MEEFCGSEFWNTNQTWNTHDPSFTRCFERTVLVWTPCAFLWCASVLDIFYMRNAMNRNIPWGWLNLSKLIVTAVLMVISLVDMIVVTVRHNDAELYSDVHPVDFWTPTIKALTFLYSAFLMIGNMRRGLRTSGPIFLFWLLLVVFAIPQMRSEVRAHYARTNIVLTDSPSPPSWPQVYEFGSFVAFFVSSLVMLVLNCYADGPPQVTKYPKTKNACPEQQSSFLSKLFYVWFDGLAWQGYRNPLEQKDLWDMNPEDTSEEVLPLFDKYWSQSVAHANAKNAAAAASATTTTNGTAGGANKTDDQPKSTASIVPAICKAFGPIFLFGSALKLAQDLLLFVSPQILRLIIQFVNSSSDDPLVPRTPLWHGITYAVLLFAVATVQTLFLAHYFHRMSTVGLRIRTALIGAIYRKSLVLSNASRKDATVGEIVNLMSVDAQRFMDLTTFLNMLWSAPLQIGLALYFLWEIMGPSVLAGFAVMLILIPVNTAIANRMKVLQVRQMKCKDERVKMMNEVLNGIKVLKLYAWEQSFEEQVLHIREKEIKVMRQASHMNAAMVFVWACAPFMVSLVTFAVFVLADENNVLTAEIAFVSLALFNIIRFPLIMLPMVIMNMVQTSVSVKRLNKFLNSQELDPENVQHDDKEKHALFIENGTFSWGGDGTVLRDINLSIAKGQLAAVVGTVGSGKSSLIAALLGEMEKLTGRVNTSGSIAYVSQQAWIQNCTLQDNILFGRPMNKSRYDRVIRACALRHDLDMLPAGDQTEIGEKGINLSGGQKQRVSLARAVYNDADVFMLDDPLSAVDSHVSKHIFDEVIGPNGILAGKTRVLVTHGITNLPQVDAIVVLKDGHVSEAGSYKQLMGSKGAFAEFLLAHLQEIGNETDPTMDDADLEELKAQLVATAAASESELLVQLERVILKRSESRTESTSAAVSSSSSRRDSLESLTASLNSSDVRKRAPICRQESTISVEQKLIATPKKDVLIEKEKMEVGNVKSGVYAYYLRSIGLALSLATILLNIGFQGFSIGSNVWLSRWAVDTRVGDDPSVQFMYLGVYGMFGLLQAISVLAGTLSQAYGALAASTLLHRQLLDRVLRLPMEWFDTTPTGRILSRFSGDINTCDLGLPNILTQLLRSAIMVLATIFVISFSTVAFLIVILPMAVLYYLVQRYYVATSRQLKRLESVSRSPIYSHFGETIQGSQTIRAFNVQQRFINESETKVDRNQICAYPGMISQRWLAVRLEIVANLIILFAALFAVLSAETIDAGLVGLSVSYAMQVTQTLNMLVRVSAELETNIVAVERIMEYDVVKTEAPRELPNKTLSSQWPEAGAVQFRDFQVRYREGLELVLDGLTFDVRGGEKVGIVGRTSAGKSSLTLALFRIIESAGGSIMIDGENIADLGLQALRSRLTIMPQDPVLFSGSLRMNLDPFGLKSDDELWRALEHAHLSAFVSGLTAGLNHTVTEGGENLSVGQRQLVCLARALLRKTKVLILDEATAAVDLETDDLIQKTIRSEFADCTVLTIAHRLNTIMDSDKVLVLDKGRVAEFAAPQTLLLDKSSAFYSMAKDSGLV